jgi:uroporphyrinogen decarboxylase
MDDAINSGIDAKHSNENIIADFDRWIDLYGDRIGLFGGIDVDVLCQADTTSIYNHVVDKGTRYRARAKGYSLGSGNSIPAYIPVEGYLAMIKAVQKIRENELNGLN